MRDWLRQARLEKGLKMKEVGETLGIFESYYCAIEAGDRQQRMDLMIAAGLSAILDIPIADIAAAEMREDVG